MAEPKKLEKGRPKKVINQGTMGSISGHAGETISLNMKISRYFGLGRDAAGQNKLWLSPEQWCARVPNNLTQEETTLLERAIRSGEIILGKRWLPVIRKDPTILKKWEAHLKDSRRCDEKFKEGVKSVLLNKREGNYTAIEIIRHMLKIETSTKNRAEYLSFLTEAAEHYMGPVSLVEDFPEDPDNYIVAIDPSNGSITPVKPVPEFYASELPVDPERAKKIENALG